MNNFNPYNTTASYHSNRNDGLSDTETLDILGQISSEVNAGLNKTQLSAAMDLLRLGVNPAALVAITQELRREALQKPAGTQGPAGISTSARSQTQPANTYNRQQPSYSRQGYSSGSYLY